MRIVEISGIKLEVDERTARSIEQYKVGDRLKVLIKSYGESYNVYPGVIVGFADFKMLPTIEVMYLKADSWSTEAFAFLSLNAATKDAEIAPYTGEELLLDRESVLDKLDRAIIKAEADLDDLRTRKTYFIERFAQAFERKTESVA